MGTRTPNISIYVPANGEEMFNPAFQAGMTNIDAHDHTGAPTRGVQLGTNSLQNGAVTPAKASRTILNEAFLVTNDAVAHTIQAIPILVATAVTISGRFVANGNNANNAIGGDFLVNYYRTLAGNVTAFGAQIINTNTVPGTAASVAFSVTQDVGTQAVWLQVTGQAATAWSWHVVYNVTSQP